MADAVAGPADRMPRLCWLPLQRPDCANTELAGVVLLRTTRGWQNIETGSAWPGDPFAAYVGAVELDPVTR